MRLRRRRFDALPPELVQPLHHLDVRQEVRVILLSYELAADVIRLQRDEADAVPADEIRGDDALEQRRHFIL